MSEPTITVTQNPCPICDGSRRVMHSPEIVTEGTFRKKVTPAEFRTCETCNGSGKVVRDVPVSQIAALAADPGLLVRQDN